MFSRMLANNIITIDRKLVARWRMPLIALQRFAQRRCLMFVKIVT